MSTRFLLFTRLAVITLIMFMLCGTQVSSDDENLSDDVQSALLISLRHIHLGKAPAGNPLPFPIFSDEVQCLFIAFKQFAGDLVGHRFTLLAVDADAGGPEICQVDFFRYDTNTLFRATVDLAHHQIISTQVVPNTQPAASPAEVAEARSMAEVGALADRIAATPGLVVTSLLGSGVLPSAGGSSSCITDRCIELRYFGTAGTGTAPAPEPAGASFTFADQQVVAIAVVDLTLQIVLHSEVF